MRTLSTREEPVPTLYVKSLSSFGGPESAIRQIFVRARAQAPCLLVFEDLDSLVTPRVRSYFLNEVDGLERNDGILIVGSTNHRECIALPTLTKKAFKRQTLIDVAVDQLDPGIAKRPSRFDRKYFFPLPSEAERVAYCEYWR